MRMDPDRQHFTAENIVNKANEHELVSILRNFGEERYARKIVSTILEERRKKLLKLHWNLLNWLKMSFQIK